MGLFSKKKKPAKEALDDLRQSLFDALGDGLVTLLVFGSYASGEFREGESNLNTFLILKDSNAQTLAALSGPFRHWTRQGHPAPVLIEEREWAVYARALPIEFFDMKDHHQVLCGKDPFLSHTVDPSNLHAQCEEELSIKLLKLRQSVILLSQDVRQLEKVLVASLPSVLAIFRGILRLTEQTTPPHKLEAAARLAVLADFDMEPLKRLSDHHVRRASDDLVPLAGRYLDIIERVSHYLGRI